MNTNTTTNPMDTAMKAHALAAELLTAWEDGPCDLVDAVTAALREDGVTHECPTITAVVYRLAGDRLIGRA